MSNFLENLKNSKSNLSNLEETVHWNTNLHELFKNNPWKTI